MPYTELHCHSYYSFQEGASSIEELIETAKLLDYPALALTDHNNLCGALSFAQIAKTSGIQPITGVEITLTNNSHLTLIAKNRKGYSNLCNLITNSSMQSDHKFPQLDPIYLQNHSDGIILLTGCPKGSIPDLISKGLFEQAESVLRHHLESFGPSNVFIELQNNFAKGDSYRNAQLVRLGNKLGVPVVATNNVHYHKKDRYRLQNALVAIKLNQSLESASPYLKTNDHYHLKSYAQMSRIFRNTPEALKNTIRISEQCSLDLSKDLKYEFPDYPAPRVEWFRNKNQVFSF